MFNGITTFRGNLMPNPFLEKNSRGDKGVHTFTKGISPKVTVIACLEFKLAYFEAAWFGLLWFVGFYGISTFVGYLTPNPFLCK